jgi:2-C-methyl-D-erythritol 2,4-cyclodiphosphate synthase
LDLRFSFAGLPVTIASKLKSSKASANVNPATLRIGIGHDTHRLKSGGPLRLGGIDIEHTHSLDGHSDADVLLHAVTDALLGAAALGDIGELFPDTVEENRGRDSAEMLKRAFLCVAEEGYRILNLDCIVFAQQPKLSPYKRNIAIRIAEILEIEPSQVGVKAKTGEGVGPVGQHAAMMAECIALLYRPGPTT